MAQQTNNPWRDQAEEIVGGHAAEDSYTELVEEIAKALSEAYSKGYSKGYAAADRNPRQPESMGR